MEGKKELVDSHWSGAGGGWATLPTPFQFEVLWLALDRDSHPCLKWRSSQALSLVLPDLHIYLGHLLKIRVPRLLGDSDSVGQGQSSDVFHTCNKHLRQVWKHWGSKFIIFALGGVCFSSSSSLSLWELGNSVPTLGLLRAQTAYQPPTANRLLHWVGAQYIFVD